MPNQNIRSKPSGYFVFEGQHLSFIDKQGKLVYTNYYKPMKKVDLTELAQFGANMAGIDVDTKGNMDNFKELKKLSNGSIRTGGKQSGSSQEVRINTYSVNDTPLFSTASTRFFNAQSTKDHYFVTTKSGDDTKRSILMVEKSSGTVVKTIDLVDKDPAYVVDVVDDLVYVAEKSRTLTAYKMR